MKIELDQTLTDFAKTKVEEINRAIYKTKELCEMKNKPYPDFKYKEGMLEGIRLMLEAAGVEQDIINTIFQ